MNCLKTNSKENYEITNLKKEIWINEFTLVFSFLLFVVGIIGSVFIAMKPGKFIPENLIGFLHSVSIMIVGYSMLIKAIPLFIKLEMELFKKNN